MFNKLRSVAKLQGSEKNITIQMNHANFSTGRWFILPLLLLRIVFFQTPIYAGMWSQTTQAEFELNSQSGTDIYASPGDVKINSGTYSTDSNTVLLMHFGEGSWNGTINEVGDSSGNGNHGKAYGNATTTASGKFGRAGSFDGTGGYVDCGTGTATLMGDGVTIISVELWFRQDVQNDNKGLLYIGSFNGQGKFQILIQTGELKWFLNDLDFGDSVDFTSTDWTHLAIVYDGTNVTHYLNGVAGIPKAYSKGVDLSGLKTVIGSYYAATASFRGTIDEVRISNTVRYTSDFVLPYQTSGTITSLTINSGEPITNIRLDWEDTIPAGSSITYSGSNDGGAHWYELPGDNVLFTFPSPGNDLRVKAELTLGTGTTSPVLYAWTTKYFSSLNSVVWDAFNNEAIGGAKVTLYKSDGTIYTGTSQANPQFSDENGRVSFSVQTGSYYLTATSADYTPYQSPVYNEVAGNVVRNISLTPIGRMMKKEMEKTRQWVASRLSSVRPEPPYSFVYGGVSSSDLLKNWRISHSEAKLDSNRIQHILTYTDPKTRLEVRCVAIEYADYPAVEWVVYLKNTGPQDTPILENLQALDTSWSRGPHQRRIVVHHAKGSDSRYSDFAPLVDMLVPGGQLKLHSHGVGGNRGGSSSVESLPFFNIRVDDQGMIVGMGWTGPWTAQFARDAGGAIHVQAGMERVHLVLRPGEEIRSSRIVVLFWQGDHLRAHNMWRRLLLTYYSPRPGGEPFTGLICDSSWGSWMTAATHIDEINWWGDHDLPMECYWVDAGWADMSLGWVAHQSHQVPDRKLFPNGMKPLSDAAHRRGMKFLLWMGVPGSVHPAVGIGKEHPEWLGKPFSDKAAYGTMVFHALDHGDPVVNQFMIDHFSRVVSNFGVDVFRQDGGNLWPEDTDPNRFGMSQIRWIEGFYAFWDGLLRNHPNLLIDNCGEGGKKIDIETIRRSIVLWRSDSQASGVFDPVSTQGFNYGLFPWIPLSCGAVSLVKLSAYSFRSAYCPAMELCWASKGVSDLTKDRWSGIDIDLLRRLLREYLSVRPYVFGDYYPLTPYSLSQSAWMAWQFDRPDLGEGMVQAFRRPECPKAVQQYKLHGLEPEATYTVVDLDKNKQQEMSGRALMETGLDVSVPGRPGAAVVTYKKVR